MQVEHAYERSMSPDILALIASRHSKRSFTSRPVSRDILKAVLTAATNAPSSQNNQPWQVAVVTGARRDQLSAALCDAFDQGVAPTPDYLNRPKQLPPELQQRCEDYGRDFLTFKGIARDDAEGRHQHRRDNFLFYGAPVEMIFHLPANAAAGTFLDLGFFMQNVILGLEGYGLASCPQYSVASYSDVVRHHLGLSPDRLIVSGMAVGHPDRTSPLNTFFPQRAPIDTFTQWYGWSAADSPAADDTTGQWASEASNGHMADNSRAVHA